MSWLTPVEWLTYLTGKLAERQPHLAKLQAYYDGDHPMPLAPKKATEKYRELARQARTNWMQLVVDAPAERLKVVGFRFSDDAIGDDAAAPDDAAVDLDVWKRIWQGNQLDADHKLVQSDALALGSSFVLVWPDASHPSGVRITPEHATQCIVEYEPGERRTRAAGLKAWVGPDRYLYATLYLPGEVYKFRSATAAMTLTSTSSTSKPAPPAAVHESVRWEPRAVAGESWPVMLELKAVPLVEIRPRPRWDGVGLSELDGLTDIQDRINTTIFNRLVAAEAAAFPQRWGTGIEVEEDENGTPIKPFDLGVDTTVIAEDEKAKFGQFAAANLDNYLKPVEADVQHLAAISKTPPQYLLGTMINVSGDALAAAESGLVSKVRDRQAQLGEDWEEVIRLALAAIDDPRARDLASEVIWEDPETRSEAEHVDAVLKKKALGVPEEALWEDLGATPQEIQRWKDMRFEQALTAGIAGAPGQTVDRSNVALLDDADTVDS